MRCSELPQDAPAPVPRGACRASQDRGYTAPAGGQQGLQGVVGQADKLGAILRSLSVYKCVKLVVWRPGVWVHLSPSGGGPAGRSGTGASPVLR